MPVDNDTQAFFKQLTEAQKAFLDEVTTMVVPSSVNPLKRDFMRIKEVNKMLEEVSDSIE